MLEGPAIAAPDADAERGCLLSPLMSLKCLGMGAMGCVPRRPSGWECETERDLLWPRALPFIGAGSSSISESLSSGPCDFSEGGYKTTSLSIPYPPPNLHAHLNHRQIPLTSRQLPPRDRRRPRHKLWMIRIYVSCLDGDQAADVFRGWAEAFAEQFGDDFDELRMEVREALQFLFTSSLLGVPASCD